MSLLSIDTCCVPYPKTPRNFDALRSYPGNTVFMFVAPRCFCAISPNTSRKSVVNARSRPSYN